MSKFCKKTVEPKITFPSLFILVTSITFALAIILSISWILPSLWDCCSFAACYSAFSFKSPCDRASEIAAIAEARSHGDLKENAEYHAAKEEQSHSEGRITEINDIIARANVIDVTKLTNDGKIIFGSTVYLENLDTGEKIN